jgi:hypothetical protein
LKHPRYLPWVILPYRIRQLLLVLTEAKPLLASWTDYRYHLVLCAIQFESILQPIAVIMTIPVALQPLPDVLDLQAEF